MEVHLTPEQEAHLAQIAADSGVDAEQLARKAVLRLLDKPAQDDCSMHDSVVAEMRRLRSRIPPDREGWSTRDYVNYGRK